MHLAVVQNIKNLLYLVIVPIIIYRSEISPKFQRMSFIQLANIIYNEFKGIAFGIQVDLVG